MLGTKKKCNKCKNQFAIEGECDFIIICPDSFIVIEVKNMENVGEVVECEPDFHLCSIGEDWQPECNREQQLRALNGTFEKSVKQRNKVVDLIRNIFQDANILQFTAYPNFSKQFKEEFQLSEMKESRLSDDELSTVIFEEDMSNTNFAAWWVENVTQAISSVRRAFKETLSISTAEMPISGYNQNSHEKARNMLLAIWATEKNTCEKSKCSLGRCIMNVNKELKEGRITFEPKKGKNRDQNPGVVKAPDVISRCVGVLKLTTQQNDVFYSSEKLLWINGPAGAGKTVILCGKIIQLIQSDRDSKVVVFKFVGPGNNSQHYQHALDKASIEYKLISTSKDDHTPAQLADLITESSCSVIIVEITDVLNLMTLLTDILSVLSGYNLFVDDIQTVIDYDTTAEMYTVLIDKLLELSADKTVWIACDIVQAWALLDTDMSIVAINLLTNKLTPNQRATLSMNLRNTFDLSNILSVIRDQFVTLYYLKSDNLDLVLPTQLQGHFIHGPLPVINVFNDYNVDNMIRVFDIELDRLCAMDEFDYSDIGIVATYVTSSEMSLIEDSINRRSGNTGSKIAVCDSGYCASSEWPAVIVLHQLMGGSEERDLTALYLTFSRARVHCSVLIFPWKGDTLDVDTPHVLHLLDKLSNYARIIRY